MSSCEIVMLIFSLPRNLSHPLWHTLLFIMTASIQWIILIWPMGSEWEMVYWMGTIEGRSIQWVKIMHWNEYHYLVIWPLPRNWLNDSSKDKSDNESDKITKFSFFTNFFFHWSNDANWNSDCPQQYFSHHELEVFGRDLQERCGSYPPPEKRYHFIYQNEPPNNTFDKTTQITLSNKPSIKTVWSYNK